MQRYASTKPIPHLHSLYPLPFPPREIASRSFLHGKTLDSEFPPSSQPQKLLRSRSSPKPFHIMPFDFNAPVTTVKPPSKLAHIFLRTDNFQQMIDYYLAFLGAHVVYQNENIAFLTYDDEHHRIALLKVPANTTTSSPSPPASRGLEHIAFTFDSLSELLLAYRQRKQLGMLPVWPVNHGPTTSIYYQDPDGNRIETQIDNFAKPEDATAFMASEAFAENPFGTDFDPEEWIARLERGESEQVLMKRVESGPRSFASDVV